MKNFSLITASLLLGCFSACAPGNANVTSDTPTTGEDLSSGQLVMLESQGMAIGVSGASTSDGAAIVDNAVDNDASQQWTMYAASQGAFMLTNKQSGKCLEVAGSSKTPSAPLQQNDCVSSGQANQMWWFNDAGNQQYQMVNVNSGLVITASSGSSSLVQAVNSNSPTQLWTSTSPGGGSTGNSNSTGAATGTGGGTSSTTGGGTASGGTPGGTTGGTTGTAVSPDAEAVRSAIKTVLDTPHTNSTGESRGGPGVFEALPSATVDEYVASIIDCANRYMPPQLPLQQRAAMIIADINAESTFNPATDSIPGSWAASVGPQQVTPDIWVPFFQAKGNGTGLTHYDGSAWTPASTTNQAMLSSIWDNMHVANWSISTEALNGGHDPNAGPGGPMAQSWWTGLYCWVSGYPAADSGGDATQSGHYRAMQIADLTLLGYDATLIDTVYASRPAGD